MVQVLGYNPYQGGEVNGRRRGIERLQFTQKSCPADFRNAASMKLERRKELFGHLLPLDDPAKLLLPYGDEDEFRRVQRAMAEILLKITPLRARPMQERSPIDAAADPL